LSPQKILSSQNIHNAKHYDVVGIGNAMVDILSREAEAFIGEHQLNKGNMTLVALDRSNFLRSVIGPSHMESGGSAANTIVGVADLGGRTGFIGKVGVDELGQVFREDIRAAGVTFDVPSAVEELVGGQGDLATARCIIIVTPDAVRTMNTYLGAAAYLYPDDIDANLIASAKVLYCEGYIWDVPITKQAIRGAIDIARRADTEISFTLSDTRCVSRHLREWHELLDGSIDILFGNEAELAELTGATSLAESVEIVRQKCKVVCATRGKHGSLVVTQDEIIEIAPYAVPVRVDTTGAGDMYAAGFLYGYTAGLDLELCGRLASVVAGEIITQHGARYEKDLVGLVERELGINCGDLADRLVPQGAFSSAGQPLQPTGQFSPTSRPDLNT